MSNLESLPPNTRGLALISNEVLTDLKHKLLSVFSLPPSMPAPASGNLLQRGKTDTGGKFPKWRANPMNDFHRTSFKLPSSQAWTACLRVQDAEADYAPLVIPLAYKAGESVSEEHLTMAASWIHDSWPQATLVPNYRRRITVFDQGRQGNQLLEHQSVVDSMTAWIASQRLEGDGNSAMLAFVTPGDNGYLNMLEGDYQMIRGSLGSINRPGVQIPGDPPISVAVEPPCGQLWSFVLPVVAADAISFPIVAATMRLMLHPNRQSLDEAKDCQDLDISWCLDALHAHARLSGPDEDQSTVNTDSWFLETCGDSWLYFHFTFHYFVLLSDPTESDKNAQNNNTRGLLRHRRRLVTRFAQTLEEERKTLMMRVCTERDSKDRCAAGWDDPSFCRIVGFVLDDGEGHERYDLNRSTWDNHGLVCQESAGGVALFQQTLWTLFDGWKREWSKCLSQRRGYALDIDASILTGNDERLNVYIFDDEECTRSKKYFTIIQQMAILRKHIKVAPSDLHNMRTAWTRTYSGLQSSHTHRFKPDTQIMLNQNWDKLEEHVARLHKDLINQSREIESDVRMAWRDLTSMATLRPKAKVSSQ